MASSSNPTSVNPVVEIISRQFCDSNRVTLTTNINKNEFKVDNVVKFRIKDGSTLNGRYILLDTAQKTLVTLQKKTAENMWQVFSGHSTAEKDMLFSVCKKSTQLDVFLAKKKTKDVCDFKIKGHWSDQSCIISHGHSSESIAKMHQKNKMTVESKVDQAFIAALVAVHETDP